VATTGSINSSDIRDLMIQSVERHFGLIAEGLGFPAGDSADLHRPPAAAPQPRFRLLERP